MDIEQNNSFLDLNKMLLNSLDPDLRICFNTPRISYKRNILLGIYAHTTPLNHDKLIVDKIDSYYEEYACLALFNYDMSSKLSSYLHGCNHVLSSLITLQYLMLVPPVNGPVLRSIISETYAQRSDLIELSRRNDIIYQYNDPIMRGAATDREFEYYPEDKKSLSTVISKLIAKSQLSRNILERFSIDNILSRKHDFIITDPYQNSKLK